MRVAIIGAGPAGLASARHVSRLQFQCDVFETGAELGGMWVYTSSFYDKFGFPTNSAMYPNLVTNLPKEVMDFPDFPALDGRNSFVTQPEVLHFLNQYAEHFHLKPLIKFNCLVTKVRPLDAQWSVTYLDKEAREELTFTYDFVLVCNGHNHTATDPKIPGQETFKGEITHSQQFRSADSFKDQDVLIVGAGPSGLDVVNHIVPVAKTVTFSHRLNNIEFKFLSNVVVKPDIVQIYENEVKFLDGTVCNAEKIVFCTGYTFSFPFLDPACGIKTDDKMVQFLYKHVVNIEAPSMAFIGIPNSICVFRTVDLQARFYCQYMTGAMKLPSRTEMLLDIENDLNRRLGPEAPKRKAHVVGKNQQNYYDDLAATAKITSVPPFVAKLWIYIEDCIIKDCVNFRSKNYKVIDDNNFTEIN